MEKIYFSYNQIHKDVQDMASTIKKSGFNPDIIVAIGTGGFIPARILKSFINRPVFTVGIAYYDMNNQPTDFPKTIQWIDEVESKLKGKKILLVDEVDDSRVTLEYCLRELLEHKPSEIGVAVLHNKDKKKEGKIPEEVHHYYAARQVVDKWVVYPWEADDIEAHDKFAENKKY